MSVLLPAVRGLPIYVRRPKTQVRQVARLRHGLVEIVPKIQVRQTCGKDIRCERLIEVVSQLIHDRSCVRPAGNKPPGDQHTVLISGRLLPEFKHLVTLLNADAGLTMASAQHKLLDLIRQLE